MSNKLILRFSLREAMGVLFMAVVLFWSAGRINWWPAWVLVILMGLWAAGTGFVIIRHDPELLAERLGPRTGAKKWDTIIMSIYGLLQLALLVVAGLDQRFNWTGGYPLPAQISGLLLLVIGHVLVVWATSVNSYFSQIVRLQSERGHHVVRQGPYEFIRHPGYLGSILTSIGGPILLASNWALLLGVASLLLMVVRTYLEDRMLNEELHGYVEYSADVKQRLLPGVW